MFKCSPILELTSIKPKMYRLKSVLTYTEQMAWYFLGYKKINGLLIGH